MERLAAGAQRRAALLKRKKNPVPVVAVVGSLNMDLVTVTPRIPSGGETLIASSFHTGPGGKGGNQAVAAVRQSRVNKDDYESLLDVKMIGTVGDDAFGADLRDGLAADGIDVEGVSVIPNCNTGVAVILVEEKSGENRILINGGANEKVLPELFPLPPAPCALLTPPPALIIMQLEIPIATVHHVLHYAVNTTPPIPVLLNPAPAALLPIEAYKKIRHLVMNETEAAILGGIDASLLTGPSRESELQKLCSQFESVGVSGSVVITLGAAGAFFWTCGATSSTTVKYGLVPAIKCDVVDTTAAGDTFIGSYAVTLVEQQIGKKSLDIQAAVERAVRASAITVTRPGAQDAIPWKGEVQ